MIELKLIEEFPQEIIAVDEVGRGPLSGPVVIGAVRLEVNDKLSFQSLLKTLRQKGIKDSKLISPEQRQEILFKLNISPSNFRETSELSLKSFSISYLTWEMDHEVIDRENILAASLRGMKEASLHLSKKKNIKTTILIDGNQKFRWDKTPSPFNELPIIKGDSLSVLIGLASIIAKEKRDIYMKEMHELYPQYGFKNHFGYPTKEHREAIKLFGPSPIHRRTFKGVREYTGS
jgi:ribonuclease HII